jgi:quercetin dioxygenase-like cupin family protein
MVQSEPVKVFPDLLAEMPDIPQNGILSRTIFETETVKAVLFAFDSGQELSEHTSTRAAMLHFLVGEATVTLGEDIHHAQVNSWVYMPPNLPHAIVAQTPVVMLLLMEGD